MIILINSNHKLPKSPKTSEGWNDFPFPSVYHPVEGRVRLG
jgi:hypothetical protein